MFFRRLQGLFAVKMRCENGEMQCGDGKMRCGNGEIVVYLRRVHAWFPAFLLPRWRNCGAIAAVGGVVAAEIHCVTAVA